ncbi:MAG: signal peptidase II [Selenomonas sp.]|uniref:signal peptidase II n=1 Tax=Selenomonas sp. TaxID=2053611 RepID=UPI0025E7E54C|nr:signal peptidase II [Selenomonas sp.]MCR5756970.1 signal peptidase II [Selenomonas sp.]
MAGGLFIVLLALDQFVKALVTLTMVPGESIPVVGGFFHITYVLNPGAAFGILPHQSWFFILAGAAMIAAFCFYYPRLKQQCAYFHYGCIALLSGSVSNLIDRVRSGLVIDFFDFRVWPVFNIADIAIVLGVASMIYAILYKEKETDE